MIFEDTNKENGEMIKPYETLKHKRFGNVVMRQVKYIRSNIKDEDGNNLISGVGGDVLTEIMFILLGYYGELGTWLADEKFHLNDMKTALELKMAEEFVLYKGEGETNEVARMKAKIACGELQTALDESKHDWDRADSWKKYVGRCHDSIRSQLGYEKQLAYMNK